MKRIPLYIAALLMASANFTACSLDEVNMSSVDSGSYFKGETEYEQLINECYQAMRPLHRETIPMWYGTDMYTRQGDINQANRTPTNDYTVVGGDEYLGLWNYCYSLITKINTALTRGENIPDVSESLKSQRTAEIKAMRAYGYFILVENFGGVPIVLQESTTPTYEVSRASEETVYQTILDDLSDENIAALPDKPSQEQFGRVTKGFAYHLLAKVYLTRSYKSYGNKNADLTSCITNADKAIALHPLLTGTDAWTTLFGNYEISGVKVNDDKTTEILYKDRKNPDQQNTEVIYSVMYSTDQTYNGGWGNNLYEHFKPTLDKLPGFSLKAGPYWCCDGTYQPTAYYTQLFDENDVRGKEQFLQRNIIAAADDEKITAIKAGKPSIYCPRVAMTDAEKATYKANHPTVQWVINPYEYYVYLEGQNYNAFTVVWKFYDPNITKYLPTDQNPEGSRNTYVFRSAETLLLKAEALVQQGGGSSSAAKDLINQLRTRAGAAPLTKDADLNDVLDESARELFGEANRWMDLKRTGTLFERAWKHNPWTQKQYKSASEISENCLVRPIPITEITYSNNTLEQNPGYPKN